MGRKRVPKDTPEGRLLRAWRDSQGLSQDDLGARIIKGEKFMDGSTLGVYERGASRPTIGQLVEIINALEVPGATEEERLSRFFAGPRGATMTPAEIRRARIEAKRLYDALGELGVDDEA